MTLSILDKSLAELEAAIPSFSLGELEVLRKAEEGGKTRKGALALLDAAIASAQPPEDPAEPEEAPDEPQTAPEDHSEADPCIITPAITGMTIRLQDGTRLSYGESAATTPEHAAHLRELGLAK